MTADDTPAISVVMPVRNAEPFLDESVGSILEQTFRDFELVILDDASTDGSYARLQLWAARDRRIRLHHSESLLGVVAGSNFVVRHSRAPFVARMDADDVSLPSRLARQLDVLRKSADITLVGALHEAIDTEGRVLRPRDRWRLLRPTLSHPFAHGSAMYRRMAFDECGGYREGTEGWEDNDLFLRLASRGKCIVITDVLYRHRYHAVSVSITANDDLSARRQTVRSRCLQELREGRDYTPLLLGGVVGEPGGDAYRYAAAMRVWVGLPANVLRTMLRRRASLRSLLWATWATLSPASLRFAIRVFLHIRDRAAGIILRGRKEMEWRFR